MNATNCTQCCQAHELHRGIQCPPDRDETPHGRQRREDEIDVDNWTVVVRLAQAIRRTVGRAHCTLAELSADPGPGADWSRAGVLRAAMLDPESTRGLTVAPINDAVWQSAACLVTNWPKA